MMPVRALGGRTNFGRFRLLESKSSKVFLFDSQMFNSNEYFHLFSLFLLFIFGSIVCYSVPLVSKGGEPHYLVEVSPKFHTNLTSKFFKDFENGGFDILPNPFRIVHPLSMQMIVSKEDFNLLQDSNNETYLRILETTGPLQIPGYRNLAAINQILRQTQVKYPQLARVLDIAKEFGPGKTHEGRPIFAIRFSNDTGVIGEEKPAILILSAHHCREIVTPEIALRIVEKFPELYNEGDSLVRKVIDRYQLFVVPILNVDGLEYVWSTNRLWRKNRKPTSTRNVFGIDLNRNYNLDWVRCGGSTNPSSEEYKGPSFESEEEIQSVVGLANHYRFVKVLDFHSFGREVLHGYHPCTNMDSKIRNYIVQKARDLAVAYSNSGMRNPAGNGQHQSWNMKVNTFYSFLVETHTTFQPSIESARLEITRVWPLILKFLNESVPLSGTVTDAATGQPIPTARIIMKDFDFYANETRSVHPRSGKYHLFLPNGDWNFVFEAPGYESLERKAALHENVENTLNIQLKLKK